MLLLDGTLGYITTVTVSEVATVLLWHINSLLLKVTAYWPVEI